jgi:MFS family permease
VTHPYVTLTRSRDVTVRLGAVFASAASLGMLSLTVVLCVHGWTGSFAVAGLAGGLFNLGNAAGIALQGRLLDRVDDRAVVTVAGAACVVAILAFVVAGTSGAPDTALLATAGLAGACVPALTAAVRTWLPRAIPTADRRTASYALLSVVFQTAIVLGPALVAVCVALGEPPVAAVTAGGLVGVATVAYVAGSRGGRQPVAAPSTTVAHVDRRLAVVLGVTALSGAAAGTLVVALPALMLGRGVPALSGVLFAVIAVGEVGGALVYGARRSRRPSLAHLVVLLTCAAALYVCAAAAAQSVPVLLATLLLLGIAVGPVSVTLSALLDDVVPAEAVGRAYGLMVSVSLVAIAVGGGAAGALVERTSPATVLVLAGVLALAGAVTAALGRTRAVARR